MRSVLQDWVMELGLREQGTLLTGIRGCDSAPKFPLDSPERNITAFIRYSVMVPFDPREVDSKPGCFMRSTVPDFNPSFMDQYPIHWCIHMLHAIQIIGFYHPSFPVAKRASQIYLQLVDALHLNPESLRDMKARLNEDRIAKGKVVS